MIAIDRAVIVKRKRILAAADVAGIDAAQAEGFQVPDQCAIAGTRLGKGVDALAKVRDQRQHGSPWRRVEIGLAALEVGSLTHQQLSVSGGADSSREPMSGPSAFIVVGA